MYWLYKIIELLLFYCSIKMQNLPKKCKLIKVGLKSLICIDVCGVQTQTDRGHSSLL